MPATTAGVHLAVVTGHPSLDTLCDVIRNARSILASHFLTRSP